MRAVAIRRVYLSILLIAAAACACARHGQTDTGAALNSGPHEVKVEVSSIGMDRGSGAHYVLLEDESQNRALPILIGDIEAQAIMLELHGLQAPRPMTHDLLRSVIEDTGNHVQRVVISDMRDDVYYAKIFLDHGKNAIDSRPSDAIALAMGTNAPIYVTDTLLESRSELGIGPAAHFPRSEHGAGIRVQELTPELAAYFNVAPKSALLVAAADSQAMAAGLRPGDLVTKINGKPVTALADFGRELAAHKDGEPFTLTIKRGDTEQDIAVKPDSSARN